MLFKNAVSGETTHNHGLAMLWIKRGESVNLYRFNGKSWDLIGGWIAA